MYTYTKEISEGRYMKKDLTPRQQKVYDDIIERKNAGFLDRKYANDNIVMVHQRYKEEWSERAHLSGYQEAMLQALEKKGWLRLEREGGSQGGQMNPKTGSWGYSVHSSFIWAEIL